MSNRNDLQDWVYEALESLNGKGRIVDVAKQGDFSHTIWTRSVATNGLGY